MPCLPFRIGIRAAAVLLLLLIPSHCLFANAKTISRIIDDTYGDQETGFMPIYYPQGDTVWQDKHCGAQEGCLIVPDPSLVQNGTWTAATYRTDMNDMGLRLQFKGTAISVYFIIANNVSSTSPVSAATECTFTLNGIVKKKYEHQPKTTQHGLEYNVEVYNETGLEYRLNILEIATGKLDHEVYIAFDYAKYTTQVPDDKETDKHVSVRVIVGVVVSGIVFLFAVAIVVLVLRRRRRVKDREIGKVTPLFVPPRPESTSNVNFTSIYKPSSFCYCHWLPRTSSQRSSAFVRKTASHRLHIDLAAIQILRAATSWKRRMSTSNCSKSVVW